MADKQMGKVDPTGNYGLGQAEADKARAFVKTHYKDEDPAAVERMRQRLNPGSVTPGQFVRDAAQEAAEEHKKGLSKARSAAYRARKPKE